MRNVNRISMILDGIRLIWEEYPDLRLGQLICNVVRDPELYYIEDEDLIKELKEFYKNVE